VVTERDAGGPGGLREGVGKTEGLGGTGSESDMVDEREAGEKWAGWGKSESSETGRTDEDDLT
jgi:hypothetical protein